MSSDFSPRSYRKAVQTEFNDPFFETLAHVEEGVYETELAWNHDLSIRIFLSVEDQELSEFLEKAKNTFLLIKEREEFFFEDCLESFDIDDFKDNFRETPDEISIEIRADGSGSLTYLVMMLGTLQIEFSEHGEYRAAHVIAQ